jgi:ethanolamine permease
MSDSKTSVAGVSYAKAEAGYFEKRSLKRTAGFWGLWGIGIAAVISGDFSGWNFGIGTAGWGGMLIATVIVVVMYFGMLFSIGEMSAAMPHTGGAYSFARASMGPWGGFVTGLAETLEYVLTTAAVVAFSAGYADSILFTLTDGAISLPFWAWWLILYAIFVALNAAGSAISFRFALVVAIISLAVLATMAILAIATGSVDFARLLDIEPDPGETAFLPHGLAPVLFALPFAVWFFLGIEELPLAAEEAHNPTKDIPKAGIWGLITLVVSAGVVLVLNPAVTGADVAGSSSEPILDVFRAVIPNAQIAAALSAFALLGLLASLQGIMFAAGRNMYSLSRAGYYPKFLSLTGKRQTPWVALLVGSAIGLVAMALPEIVAFANAVPGEYEPGSGATIVLNIAVWGAVISYTLQMVSFVLLRRKFPNAKRPYKSPVGLAGALVAGVIAVLIFVGQAFNHDLTSAIVVVAIVYVLALALFALFGRTRLVLSPEEEYALSGGLHGDPQAEGYDAMEDEVFGAKTAKKAPPGKK